MRIVAHSRFAKFRFWERDKPDIRVDFIDGASVYAEVRLVESGQIREARFIEDANHVLMSGAAKDDVLRERLARSNVTISLQTLPNVSMHQLLKETRSYIKSILGNEKTSEKIQAIYPALHLAGARALWEPKDYEQARIIQKNAAWIDGDYISVGARESIVEKMELAKDYDPNCVPLWLLLGIIDIRPLPGTASAILSDIFEEYSDVKPFTKLVATAAGMAIVSKSFP